MQFAFRVDASLRIGTGHVIRCLTLADTLRERGAQSLFICRLHAGHLLDLIHSRGHTAIALDSPNDLFVAPTMPQHAQWLGIDWAHDAEQTQQALSGRAIDWLVVDHYSLERRWEHALRSHTRGIFVIDDLADRHHDCDLLLDQNLGRQSKDYEQLINSDAQTLIGSAYALLRPEFTEWRDYSLKRRAQTQLQELLITMGGVDESNVTGQVLDALTDCKLPADLRITVIMGVHAPWLALVRTRAATMPRSTQVLVGVNNMAQLMAQSDLCIGAAGGSAWERCALGLPTITLILADNQVDGARALQSHGAVFLASDLKQLIEQMSALSCLDKQRIIFRKMSQDAANLVKGDGVSRVLEFLLPTHA